MKTLENHQLIYDKDCPMCRVYSCAFISCKMLDENGRENFRDLNESTKEFLDVERAKNEIALVDLAENKVYYGLDSLLIIIGNSFPFLEKIGRINFVYWFFKKLYSFISFNRKQIIPSENDFLENACVPTFNLKYRLLFIFSCLLLSSYILNLMLSKFEYSFNFSKILLIFVGLFLWQILFLKGSKLERYFNYLGNLATIILAGSLILIPFLFFNLDLKYFQIIFCVILFLMLIDHFRRCSILKINTILTCSLLLYFIAIAFILKMG